MTETSQPARMATPQERPAAERGTWATTLAGLAGALAMTSCCILPLLLVSFGIGGVWIARLTALYAYKWVIFAIASALIGLGFWKLHRSGQRACADGAACARPVNRRLMRALLWLAVAITALAMIFPYLTPYLLSY